MSARRVPGIRAPWIAGLMVFLILATAAGIYMSRSRDFSPVPQSVLDSRRESTVAAEQAITRSLNGGLSSLAEIATVVDESLSQRNRALMVPFKSRMWKSLYVVDRASHVVVAQVGESAQPAVLGEPAPTAAGLRLAQVGTAQQIVQYTPVGKAADAKYLLVGHLDPNRLSEQLAVAGPDGAWLLDKSGSVIVGPAGRTPPQGVIDPDKEMGESTSGSRAQRAGERSEVIAWASLSGKAPSNMLGWTVVSNQPTTETAAPTDASQRRAITVSAVLAALTVVVFAVLYFALVRPVRLLRRVAEAARQDVPRAPKHGEAGRIASAFTSVRRPSSHRKPTEGQ
ncbi:hypothetical protein [Amycolatopsis sp. NPDC051128]|uniref:hypothetical protein n=1 Tax=Amycolatopsis sp. NPDC051128 TaxID=3155412 RepID=UPI0034399899